MKKIITTSICMVLLIFGLVTNASATNYTGTHIGTVDLLNYSPISETEALQQLISDDINIEFYGKAEGSDWFTEDQRLST